MLYYIYYNILYYNIYNIKLVAPYLPPKLIFQNVARSAVAHVASIFSRCQQMICKHIFVFAVPKYGVHFILTHPHFLLQAGAYAWH